SVTGKTYGPEFVDRGIEIGKGIYRELSRMLGGPRMELFTDLEQVEGCCAKKGVVTLGNFDGLHIGHQVLIGKVVNRAREIGGNSIVFTFHPHPLKVLSPDTCPPLISTYEEKIALFEELGIDLLLMIPFTRKIAEMSAWDFAETVLANTLNASEVFVGFNYRFGRDREGSVDRLREFGEKLGFRVTEVREVTVHDEVVSSTKIRDLLRAGNVDHAARLLGRPYAITGRVVKGDQRGRTLGFPTANVEPVHEIMPYPGVYAVRVFLEGKQYDGVANAGFRPTFDKRDLCLEAHILDFSGEVYGKEITLFFVAKIRDEKRFESLEALKAQIEKDIVEGRKRLHSQP
ncbi:MAG: bifunctional riboflavin kinase/FAD synthetase, partial [Thermodesulfobacteriota bacterium]